MTETPSMISLEEAQALVVSSVKPLDIETVPLLDAIGRVAAADLTSDMDVSPFAHAAMDGFAVHAAELVEASEENPVDLRVIDEVPAGGVFEGVAGAGECVRIMTGAALPDCVDAVEKYEVVGMVEGDGKTGSVVRFTKPVELRNNVREPGEEAKKDQVIVEAGEVISSAGVGFLASCGVLEVSVRKRPRVAVIPIGSELVDPPAVPGPGHIRNSNSYAIAACVANAGGVPDMLPIVVDDLDLLTDAVLQATQTHDFVITTGGASNGDYDFIKPVVEKLGELRMTSVNMRPGKAQTFGLVNGVPVFGLPGNPAAAFMGFELIIRRALRTMQGYTALEHPHVFAKLTQPRKKKDPRRLFLRATLTKDADGTLLCTPAKNQSSGLLGIIQKSNCMAIMPEGTTPMAEGDLIECILLDVPEEVVL